MNRRADVAWKNAFLKQYGQSGSSTPLFSESFWGQTFDLNVSFAKEDPTATLENGSTLLGHNFFEIDSRITGDWGNITLSFEKEHITDIHDTSRPLDTTTSQDPAVIPSTLKTKRTSSQGRLNITENIGLAIELEYLYTHTGTLDDLGFNTTTLAYAADLNTSFGNLDTRTIYFHMDRNHDFSHYGDYSLHSHKGNQLRPLYILTGTQSDIFAEGDLADNFSTEVRQAGIDGIAFIADYKATPRLELHTAFGAANADKTPLNYDDYYGWEANMGIGYKILDNLTYEVHLGYMATGDFFQKGDDEADTEDISIITQHLTMKF